MTNKRHAVLHADFFKYVYVSCTYTSNATLILTCIFQNFNEVKELSLV